MYRDRGTFRNEAQLSNESYNKQLSWGSRILSEYTKIIKAIGESNGNHTIPPKYTAA